MNTPPARLQTLPEIEAALWRELGRAALDRHHEWRTPVLASADADGVPDARTVVLREVDAGGAQLVLYSDARAGKVRQLRAQPLGVLVLWSTRLSWQLRVQARFEVHSDGLAASSRWLRLRASPAARDYLAPQAPGQALEASGSAAPSAVPISAGAAAQRGHFAVVLGSVLTIDWLELHRDGHRRARFGGGSAAWLSP